jgi:hypothetical protein
LCLAVVTVISGVKGQAAQRPYIQGHSCRVVIIISGIGAVIAVSDIAFYLKAKIYVLNHHSKASFATLLARVSSWSALAVCDRVVNDVALAISSTVPMHAAQYSKLTIAWQNGTKIC